ncbi:hypothetical protein CEN46_24990, partial [Fischerella thermalis CCMEE 5318]
PQEAAQRFRQRAAATAGQLWARAVGGAARAAGGAPCAVRVASRADPAQRARPNREPPRAAGEREPARVGAPRRRAEPRPLARPLYPRAD